VTIIACTAGTDIVFAIRGTKDPVRIGLVGSSVALLDFLQLILRWPAHRGDQHLSAAAREGLPIAACTTRYHITAGIRPDAGREESL
jgi:hypothetical protein